MMTHLALTVLVDEVADTDDIVAVANEVPQARFDGCSIFWAESAHPSFGVQFLYCHANGSRIRRSAMSKSDRFFSLRITSWVRFRQKAAKSASCSNGAVADEANIRCPSKKTSLKTSNSTHEPDF